MGTNFFKKISVAMSIPALTFAGMFSIYACASFGQFSKSGGTLATGAISTAQKFLHDLDTCYAELVRLKALPDYTTAATRALSIADQAAKTLKSVIAGATVTDEALNVAVGQAAGANALLAQMTETGK